MRLRTTGCLALVLLAGVWMGTGCSKNEPAEQRTGQGTTTAQPGETAAGGEVTLAGTLGCGHCTYHVTADCSPCVKTAAGAIYVIDGAGEGSELMEKRFDALEVAVVGTVAGSEDPKHIAMTSYTIK